MGQLTVNRQGPEVQLDAELSYDERMGRNVVEVDPFVRPGRLRGPDILALGLVGGATWLIGLLVFGAWRGVACWEGCYGAEATGATVLLWAWLCLPLVAALGGGAAWAWGHVRRTGAEAARVGVTRDRLGNPVSAHAVHAQKPETAAAALRLATDAEVAVAPYRMYRGVDALTLSNTAPAPTASALPAVDVGPLPLERWAALVDAQPHTLLASKTGGGKSTMARFLLARRVAAGGELCIIDPHWAPANWWGLPGAGAGEDWRAVAEAFDAVTGEYHSRLLQHAKGRTDFRRLTVLVDEAVITRAAFESQGKSNPWTRFAAVLGSGARKVNLSVVLLTQSVNVADLGISGPLRENYSRIALDARTCRQLFEDDASKARRDALAAGLPTQGDYPAAMEVAGEVFYLDRRSIVSVERPQGAEGAIWRGGVAVAPVSASAPSVDPAEAVRRLVETDRQQTDAAPPIDRVALLRALRGAGKTREEARTFLRSYGVEFDNGLWTQAGGEE